MATAATNLRPTTPLIREEALRTGLTRAGNLVSYLIAIGASSAFHVVLLIFLIVMGILFAPEEVPTERVRAETVVATETEEKQEKKITDPLTVTDIDPAALNPEVEINFNNDRIEKLSVPGTVDLNEPIGIKNAPLTTPPSSIPPPPGLGMGSGAPLEMPNVADAVNLAGEKGGMSLLAKNFAGSFYGRSGATKQQLLQEGGGSAETEARVAAGIHWLVRVQHPDGAWRMEGPFPNPGSPNDIAGTAFGLLPFLGAGKTHRPSKDNPFDKPVERAILFLLRKQDRQSGYFGGGMYAHALATIALCECYGLTQDPALRRPAQAAVNYLINAQHSGGGWRYEPGQAGDTSVSGWVIMALKSAQMAGLVVPEPTMKRAVRYLDSCRNPADEGYGYTGPGSTPTMTAVGLLCRQYLQSWGPNNPKMIKGIQNHIKTLPPGRTKNMYYYYYATQVMHHFGGEDWKWWNERMREDLLKRQSKDGSWTPDGAHASVGGRLMETSLCLLTLEVYYRYLPLYYREEGERMQRLLMGSN